RSLRLVLGGRGVVGGELEQRGDRVVALRRGGDPQREVVGGHHAGGAVVSLAVRVGAAGGLEVDAGDATPADGHHRLGGGLRAGGRVGHHAGHHDRPDRRQRDRLGGGGGVGVREQVVPGVLVGVGEDQPALGQHHDGDVAPHLVTLDGGLVVHVPGDDLLARD